MTRNADSNEGATTMSGSGIENNIAALSLFEDANSTKSADDRLIVGVVRMTEHGRHLFMAQGAVARAVVELHRLNCAWEEIISPEAL